jgi:histidinol-phosphate aminotransferase
VRPLDLSHHGDADLVPGLVDMAVNVRTGGTPRWLADRIRGTDLAAYPDQREAVAAVAGRHGRAGDEILLTAGAAEAFVLLARALRPRHAVVVHPQFTEPEAALRAAGHPVDRVVLPFPFTLDPELVPADADLVLIGNPTNPTSVAHPRAALLELIRPGRIVVVDEAFADCLPGERESLAGHDLTGLVVIRSLTKTWGLAGLRAGYLLAAPDTVRRLAAAQPLWPVSAPALTACVATASPPALREVREWAVGLAAEREHLLRRLAEIAGIRVGPDPAASFVLLDTRIADIRTRLLRRGFAVRRGKTFPGLGPGWIRVAVRDPGTCDRFTAALANAARAALVSPDRGNSVPGACLKANAVQPGPALAETCRREETMAERRSVIDGSRLFWVFLKFVLLGPALRLLFRPRVSGLEHIPARGGAILAANHVSYIDPLLLSLVIPRRRVLFLAKVKYVDNPLLHWLLRGAGVIPVASDDPVAVASAIAAGVAALRKGRLVGIFPEGTRSPDGRLHRGKTGVARMGMQSGAPVIPAGIIGARGAFPRGAKLPRPRAVRITFGPPVTLPASAGRRLSAVESRAATDQLMASIAALSGQSLDMDIRSARARG